MIATQAYPHLTHDADGTARVGTSRYKVQHLAAEHYYYGWTAEELLRQHPDLRPEEVYVSLAYFYDHYDEMTAQLSQASDQVSTAAAKSAQPFSRQDLLARRAAKGA